MQNTAPLWISHPPWMWESIFVSVIVVFLGVVIFHSLRPKFIKLHGWKSPVYSVRAACSTILQLTYMSLALIVLLLPWWWLSVLIAYPFDRSADNNSVSLLPTAVFFAGLILLYSVYIIRGFMGTHHNRKFRDQQLTDEEPPSAPKRVAVVGAGMAGLVAAKELKEEGHEVVVFEKTNSWGGVWASSKKCGGRSWNSTITSTGALNCLLYTSPSPRDS